MSRDCCYFGRARAIGGVLTGTKHHGEIFCRHQVLPVCRNVGWPLIQKLSIQRVGPFAETFTVRDKKSFLISRFHVLGKPILIWLQLAVSD